MEKLIAKNIQDETREIADIELTGKLFGNKLFVVKSPNPDRIIDLINDLPSEAEWGDLKDCFIIVLYPDEDIYLVEVTE